jgi:hypothetical protein
MKKTALLVLLSLSVVLAQPNPDSTELGITGGLAAYYGR